MSVRASLVALVPVRGLAVGKRRLAAALGERERRALIETMLVDVLRALRASPAVHSSLVVSSDPEVTPLATAEGALLLPDAPGGGLNASLTAALAWVAAACPGNAALVVPADLPVLTPALLETNVLGAAGEVVIARSLDGGTNLLLLRALPGPKLCFGPESCARHRAAARAAGCTVTIVEHPVLACDLDTAEDLATARPLLAPGRTKDLLERVYPIEFSQSGGAR